MHAPTVSPPWAYTLQLPHDPRSPGVARSVLRVVLRAHGMTGLADTAELMVSELTTNAYQHSWGSYSLRMCGAGQGRIRLSVWDSNPEIPPPFRDSGEHGSTRGARGPDAYVPAQQTSLTERGRGLALVQMCADSWGGLALPGAPSGQGGKLLWVVCGEKPE
ncbi:ATP-binding protein [Streptomyces sp. NBC_00101]|uniref:ATP-binding protein n=1 Tax=Streptomyces sp. NBC_00101 TaxID=2975651 RepID=UPI00324530F7